MDMQKLQKIWEKIAKRVLNNKEFIPVCIIIFIVMAAFLPLIFFGGFHNLDDFHFFRNYSLIELVQAWYKNYNGTTLESNAYRPLFIHLNYFLYLLLGFNDVSYMVVIIFLNILFALVVYSLARQFVNRRYSIIAALFSTILPQTLFRFTWATEIPNTIAYILILVGLAFQIKQITRHHSRYNNSTISYALFLIASFIKEFSYPFFFIIPITIFLASRERNIKRKILFLLKNKLFLLSFFTPFILFIIYIFAIKYSPERFNPNYFNVNLNFSTQSFSQVGSSYINELFYFFTPFYESFLKNYFVNLNLDFQSLYYALITLLILLISLRTIKSTIITIVSLTELIALSLYFFIKFSFIGFLILQMLPFYRKIDILYIPLFYILIMIFLQRLIFSNYKRYALLVIFLLLATIPPTINPVNRIRVLNFTLVIIILVVGLHYLSHFVPSLLRILFGTIIFIMLAMFFINCIAYSVFKNNKYNYAKILATIKNIKKPPCEKADKWCFIKAKFDFKLQQEYIDRMSAESVRLESRLKNNFIFIENASFENNLQSWGSVGDCSVNYPGKPDFMSTIVLDATDGRKGLLLNSKNHIACMKREIKFLKPNTTYYLSIDIKLLKGDKIPDLYLGSIADNYHQQNYYLANSWKRYVLTFIPLKSDIVVFIYANPGLKQSSIIYDNIKVWSREGIFSLLNTLYNSTSEFSIFKLPLFESPKN